MNAPTRKYQGNYIQGRFVVVTQSNGEVHSRNPGNIDTPAVVCGFSYEAISASVDAAENGFAHWKKSALSDRLAALAAYRKAFSLKAEALAEILSFETGKPFWEAKEEISHTLQIMDYYLHAAQNTPGETQGKEPDTGFATFVRPYPKGVAAIIAPGISPISDSHLHLIPALIYGNSVVFKASRHAPLCGQAIAEAMHTSGFPKGVFNLIHGDGEVSRRLVSHPSVQLILYTGSCETGLQIKKQVISDYWKTTVLDMVGKNSVLIWDDSRYAQALHETLYCAFLTSGQRRTTANKVLVHHSLLERFTADFHTLSKKISVGYGYTNDEDAPFLGPLLNDGAVENYIRYQAIAVREGCEEIMRGKSLERNPKGHYVSPSIHLVTKHDAKSVYQKSEIFGPNVALYGVRELEEAVEIINASEHGLVASIYSKDRDAFRKAGDSLQVGTLHWNRPTHTPTFQLPRGGLQRSGNNRPLGSLAWQQCMYLMTSTERDTPWDPDSLPKALPRGNKA